MQNGETQLTDQQAAIARNLAQALGAKKPLAVFDLETTGTYVRSARVVEIAIPRTPPRFTESQMRMSSLSRRSTKSLAVLPSILKTATWLASTCGGSMSPFCTKNSPGPASSSNWLGAR